MVPDENTAAGSIKKYPISSLPLEAAGAPIEKRADLFVSGMASRSQTAVQH
jgi:hypothetical protein